MSLQSGEENTAIAKREIKTGMVDRNELAAWLFEDMLEPPPIRDN